MTIPEMRSTFFVANLGTGSLPASVDRSDWIVDDDVRLVLPDDPDTWPGDPADPGPAVLCKSIGDPKHYEVFARSGDVRAAEFAPTGMTYGGIYSESHWGRFTGDFPRVSKFLRAADVDLPDAPGEALQLAERTP